MKILVTGVGGQLGYDVCVKVLDARKIENKGALIWRILTSRTHRQRMIYCRIPSGCGYSLFGVDCRGQGRGRTGQSSCGQHRRST